MRPAALVSLCLAIAGHGVALHGLMAAPSPKGHGLQPDGLDSRATSLRVRLTTEPAGHLPRTASAAPALARRSAPAGERTSSPPATLHDGGMGSYFASQDVDRPALPRSSPDDSQLGGMTPSGLPIRLRIYISAEGEVTAVDVLFASEEDQPVVQRLREMFLATAFIAAKRNGEEVPSYKDIDVDFSDVLPPTLPAATTASTQP